MDVSADFFDLYSAGKIYEEARRRLPRPPCFPLLEKHTGLRALSLSLSLPPPPPPRSPSPASSPLAHPSSLRSSTVRVCLLMPNPAPCPPCPPRRSPCGRWTGSPSRRARARRCRAGSSRGRRTPRRRRCGSQERTTPGGRCKQRTPRLTRPSCALKPPPPQLHCMPSFIILGVAKSGTSVLYNRRGLAAHRLGFWLPCLVPAARPAHAGLPPGSRSMVNHPRLVPAITKARPPRRASAPASALLRLARAVCARPPSPTPPPPQSPPRACGPAGDPLLPEAVRAPGQRPRVAPAQLHQEERGELPQARPLDFLRLAPRSALSPSADLWRSGAGWRGATGRTTRATAAPTTGPSSPSATRAPRTSSGGVRPPGIPPGHPVRPPPDPERTARSVFLARAL